MTTKDDITRLFRSHYAALYRLSMLIIRDDDVTKDIVHDVFEALLVSGKSYVSLRGSCLTSQQLRVDPYRN